MPVMIHCRTFCTLPLLSQQRLGTALLALTLTTAATGCSSVNPTQCRLGLKDLHFNRIGTESAGPLVPAPPLPSPRNRTRSHEVAAYHPGSFHAPSRHTL